MVSLFALMYFVPVTGQVVSKEGGQVVSKEGGQVVSKGVAQAQKTPVSGKVVDTHREAVAYGTVIFTAKNDSTQLFAAVTDDLGAFSIAVPFNHYLVEARCLGYYPSTTEEFVAMDTLTVRIPDIVIEEHSVHLSAAVVQARTIERRSDRYVVNLSANPISAGRSLYESLSYLPGVTTRNGISINGKSGTRVMVNNRMLNMSSDQIGQYLSNLRAEDIQKVEVIPDAGAEYDADATGGILKITLRRQTETGYFGSLSADIAQALHYVHGSNPNFNLSFRKNRWSVISNAYYRYYGQPDDFEENTNFLNNELTVSNKNITDQRLHIAGGEISTVTDLTEKQSLGFVANYLNVKGSINTNGVSNTVFPPNNSGIYINDNNQYQDINRLGLSVNYINQLDSVGSTFTTILDYLYAQSENGGDYNTYFCVHPNTDIFVLPFDTLSYRNILGSHNNIISANIDLDLKLGGGRNNLKAGGKFFRSQMDNLILYEDFKEKQWVENDLRTDNFTYTEGVSALYGSFSSSFAKKWIYTAGFRAEYTTIHLHSLKHDEKSSQNYLNLFPSVNLTFLENAAKGHSLTLSANRKIKRPNFSLLRPYVVPLNDFSFVEGNPNLKPAKSINLSITQSLFHRYVLTLGASFEDDYFAQIVTEKADQPDILYYQTVNLNNHTQWSASLYASINLKSWWTLTPNIVGLYIIDQYDAGKGVEHNQKPTAMCTIASHFALPNGWKPDLDGMYMTGVVQGNMVTGSFYNLNAGCSKSFLTGKLMLTVRLKNIVHKKLKITTHGETYYKSIVNNMDSRTLNVALRYSFHSGQRVNVKKAGTGTEEEKARF